MIGRLFGKNAEVLEGREGRTPVDADVKALFARHGMLGSDRVTSVDEASQAVGNMFAEKDFEMNIAGRLIAERATAFDERKLRQVTKILSDGLPEDTKRQFLFQAVTADASELVEQFIKDGDPVAHTPDTMRMMADRASERHCSKTFKMLHDQGAEHENSPAYVMIMDGDFAGARHEIAQGTDPAAPNENGNSLLHAAGFKQSARMAEVIVEAAGPEIIHQQNKDGKSFIAMSFDPMVDPEMDDWGNVLSGDADIEGLIELGAKHDFDFSQTDNKGNTLLHDFARSRQEFEWHDIYNEPRCDVLEGLLDQGIDKNAVNQDGKTSGDVALEENWPEFSAKAAGYGIMPSTDEGKDKLIDNSIQNGLAAPLVALKEQGHDWVERFGGPDVAPFQIVLESAKNESSLPVKAAHKAGLDFDVRNDKGETPFSVARDMSCNKQTMGALREIKMDIVSADIQKKAQAKSAAITEKKAARRAQMDIRGLAG